MIHNMKVEVREYGGQSIYSQNATLVVVDLESKHVSVSITPQGLVEVESYDDEGETLSQKQYDFSEMLEKIYTR